MGGTLLQLEKTTLPLQYSKHLSNILESKISVESVYSAFRKAEEWAYSRKTEKKLFSDMDDRKYQNVFYNELGITNRRMINKIEAELADSLELNFKLETGAKFLLNELSKDYRLGIISNWSMDLYDLLETLDIQKFFESITISGEYGMSKPSLEIFRSGMADFPEVKPRSMVYIGDDVNLDILPAQQLNLFPILYDKGPSGMHGWPKRPEVNCIRVEKLRDIPNILNKFNK
jgi:HAD superfamily hydrolase (TIGR01549 family)